jgi:hypothetical protein
MTGSTIMMACSPPGWLCAPWGVFVKTVIARAHRLRLSQRTKRLPLAAPCASSRCSPMVNMFRQSARPWQADGGHAADDAADVPPLRA